MASGPDVDFILEYGRLMSAIADSRATAQETTATLTISRMHRRRRTATELKLNTPGIIDDVRRKRNELVTIYHFALSIRYGANSHVTRFLNRYFAAPHQTILINGPIVYAGNGGPFD